MSDKFVGQGYGLMSHQVKWLREAQGSPLGKEKQTRLGHLVLFVIFTCDAEDGAASIPIRMEGSSQSVNI